MSDPEDPKKAAPPAPAPVDMWAETAGAESVAQLTSDTFDTFVSENPSVLIMFYAPCEHLYLKYLLHTSQELVLIPRCHFDTRVWTL